MLKFYRGLEAKYHYEAGTDVALEDALYFATDTYKIYLNGNVFGVDIEKVKDVSLSGDVLTFTKADGTTLPVNIGIDDNTQAAIDALKGLLDDDGNLNISLMYQPAVSDSVKTAYAVGALAKGTTAEYLKKKTLSQVFDEMLFPTIQPTASAPSASLSLKGYAQLQEVGAAAPTTANFNTSFNRGQITCDGVSQGYRAGEKTSDVLYRGTESSPVTDSDPVIPYGDVNYYYKVNYADGTADIKDNKGNTATSLTQLKAGSVTSGVCRVTGVYPIFATTSDANISNKTVTKLPLTTSTTITTTLAAEAADSKQVIKVKGTITKIELKDPFGNWVAQTISDFPKTTENIDVNGNSVEYNVYTRNQGQNGATEFRITYSK